MDVEGKDESWRMRAGRIMEVEVKEESWRGRGMREQIGGAEHGWMGRCIPKNCVIYVLGCPKVSMNAWWAQDGSW